MPTLVDWMNSSTAHLPKEPAPTDFAVRLGNYFADHLAAVVAFSAGILESTIQAEQANIQRLSDAILSAICHHARGHLARAYGELAVGLARVRPHLDTLAAMPSIRDLPPVYRVRVSTKPERFAREELFHIPFDLRRRVRSMRFSVEGLPCLYMGQSAYVCWEEMGRPPFSSSYISQFRFRDGDAFKFLDFAYVPRLQSQLWQFWNENGPNRVQLEQVIVALCVCWPLIAACSVKVLDRGAPFKPEYVISQMLLQWLTAETDWRGIRYFSMHVGTPTEVRLGSNLVLPARNVTSAGHCSLLAGMFEATSVWNWETLHVVSPSMRGSRVGGEIEPADSTFVQYVVLAQRVDPQ